MPKMWERVGIVSVEFEDNSKQIKQQMKNNIKTSLVAMGQTATEMIVSEMNYGFDKRIFLTGELQRDINFKIRESEQKVQVGSSLEYGIWVHEGTGRMPARPYIKNGIVNNKDAILEVGKEYLQKGF